MEGFWTAMNVSGHPSPTSADHCHHYFIRIHIPRTNKVKIMKYIAALIALVGSAAAFAPASQQKVRYHPRNDVCAAIPTGRRCRCIVGICRHLSASEAVHASWTKAVRLNANAPPVKWERSWSTSFLPMLQSLHTVNVDVNV
jgi:hypothetical protein